MKLNLGCHVRKLKGYVNIDMDRSVKPDVVADAIKMPFSDDSFEEVAADNIFEHILDTVRLMEEIHRVTRHGARIKITTPHFSSKSAYGTPDHVKYFSLTTFNRFSPSDVPRKYKPLFRPVRKHLVYDPAPHKAHPLIVWLYYPFAKTVEFLANRFPNVFERYLVYWFGGFDSIQVELETVKK